MFPDIEVYLQVPYGSAVNEQSDVFGEHGADTQLFAAGSFVEIDAMSGDLTFEVELFHNGEVTFRVELRDDGAPNHPPAASEAKFLSISVLPVNSVPLFSLAAEQVSTMQDVALTQAEFAINVAAGPWQEHDQELSFSLAVVAGPRGVDLVADLTCTGQDANLCASGEAILHFVPVPGRFGTLFFDVTLRDSLGNETTQPLTLVVSNVNDPPNFRFASDKIVVDANEGCVTSELGRDEWLFVDKAKCVLNSDLVFSRVNFAQGITFGPFEDCNEADLSRQDCGQAGCRDYDPCEEQTGSFTVVPEDADAAASVFEVLPSIALDGHIEFTLKRGVLFRGDVYFNVTLTDASPTGDPTFTQATSEVKQFAIAVQNRAPSFTLVFPNITVDEDAGPFSEQIAVNVTSEGIPTETEIYQALTFTIAVAPSDLFEVPPVMYSNGTLTFKAKPTHFGVVAVNITLTDSGGMTWGGENSLTIPTEIIVLPRNHLPTFDAAIFARVNENMPAEFTNFATNIDLGPPNEVGDGCPSAGDLRSLLEAHCMLQTATFIVVDNSAPSLFASTPVITAEGTLVVNPMPEASGTANVTVQLVDDGDYDVSKDPQGVLRQSDTFQRHTFTIRIDAIDQRPAFELPFAVTCDAVAVECNCSSFLPPTLSSSATCLPRDATTFNSRVAVLEGVGSVARTIRAVATRVTTQEGYAQGSTAVLEYSSAEEQLTMRDVGSSPVLRQPAFEFSVGHVVTPDSIPESNGRFLYSFEPETDSIAVFALPSGVEASPGLVERRVNGEQRLRFIGFPGAGETANPFANGHQPKVLPIADVCAWDTFKADGRTYAIAAKGCGRELAEKLREEPVIASGCTPLVSGSKICDVPGLADVTAGHWDLSSASTVATDPVRGEQVLQRDTFGAGISLACGNETCVYQREARTDQSCYEAFATKLDPGTFRDDTNNLGAAVMVGRPCNLLSDLDRSENIHLSVLNFLANNGEDEALQFDGLNNIGLYVADDISTFVTNSPQTSRLPTGHMALEVWFTVADAATTYAGLAAVQQDGTLCSKGWSLTYGVRQGVGGTGLSVFAVAFSISVEGNSPDSHGVLDTLEYVFPAPVKEGVWYHVLAGYNGTHVAVHVDGELGAVRKACAAPPCGRIMYPIGDPICKAKTPMTIGTYDNRMTAATAPHKGMIKAIRLLKAMPKSEEVRAMYQLRSPSLKGSPVNQLEYWMAGERGKYRYVVNSEDENALEYAERVVASPSHDYAPAEQPVEIEIMGRFGEEAAFECILSLEGESLRTAGVTSCTYVCPTGFHDTLVCLTPLWEPGLSRARLSIARTAVGQAPRPLWQRVCMEADCGMDDLRDRADHSGEWMYHVDRTPLIFHEGFVGTPTHLRFTTESALFRVDPLTETLVRVSHFGAVVDCRGRSCRFGRRTCQGGDDHGVACTSDADCTGVLQVVPASSGVGVDPVAVCAGAADEAACRATAQDVAPYCNTLDPFRILGAAAITHARIGDADYLLAANFWDGTSRAVDSVLFDFNASTEAPAFRQVFPTVGAKRLVHLHMGAFDFVAAVSLLGKTRIYRWDSDMRVLDLDASVALPVPGAVDLVHWEVGGHDYVLIAADSDPSGPAGTSVYRLTYNPVSGAPTGAVFVQKLEVWRARAALHFEQNTTHFLAVAVNDSAPSLLFSASLPDSDGALALSLEQELDTQHVVGLDLFDSVALHLLVTQRDAATLLLRWDGARFRGRPTIATPLADSAGGQHLLVSDGSSAARHLSVARAGLPRGDYMIVGSLSGVSLLQGGIDEVQALAGPAAIALHGSRAWVAAPLAAAVLAFERDPISGRLLWTRLGGFYTNRTLEAYLDDAIREDLAAAGVEPHGDEGTANDGFPLHGVASVATSSDGSQLFAVSRVDNVLAVFSVDPSSWRLELSQVLRDRATYGGRLLDGIGGAARVLVQGSTVYVAGWEDQALAVFEQGAGDAAEPLEYVDRVKEGERLFALFDDRVDPAALPGELPARLGEGRPWALSARDSKAFRIDGELILAVASSEADPSSGGGAATIYRWNSETSAFEFLHESEGDTGAAAVAYLRIEHAGVSEAEHFLVVGNSHSQPSGAGGVNVHLWNSAIGRFEHHHTVAASPTSPGRECTVALSLLTLRSGHFLVAGNARDESGCDAPSMVYRWDDARVRDANNATAPRVRGFQLVDEINTRYAADLALLPSSTLAGAETPVLLVADWRSAPGGGEGEKRNLGRVLLLAFDPSSERPVGDNVPLQEFEANGPYSLAVFEIPDVGTLLAVACRQDRTPFSDGDFSPYDQDSYIYRWNGASFEMFQRLDASLRSTYQSGVSATQAIAFCAGLCVTQDSSVPSVAGLRGASAVLAFESEGEYYLAVGQSVCEPTVSREICIDRWAQPQSALLQWNRVTGRFGELLSMTDEDNIRLRGRPVRDEEIGLHEFQLRINAGRVRAWEYIEIKDERRRMLLASSLSHGAVLYDLAVPKVEGLRGVVDLVSDPASSSVLTASVLDHRLAALRRVTLHDSLGRAPAAPCSPAGGAHTCVAFVRSQALPSGLRGAQQLFWSTPERQFLNSIEPASPGMQLVVSGGLSRDERLCGSLGAGVDRAAFASGPVDCQELSFRLDMVETDNARLFEQPPKIGLYGELTFTPRDFEFGYAEYTVTLRESGGLFGEALASRLRESEPHVLRVEVLPVNSPPTLVPNDVTIGEVLGESTAVLATSLSAGLHENEQNLHFDFTFSNPGLFATPPSLQVEGTEGVLHFRLTPLVFGTTEFQLSLIDDGPDGTPAGDRRTSVLHRVTFTVLETNSAPTFSLQPQLDLVQAAGRQSLEGFATELKLGGPEEDSQQFSFSLAGVSRIKGVWPASGLFVPGSFAIDRNGTLTFETADDVNGDFEVTVRMRDDGGTQYGGFDSSEQIFLISLLPDRPRFTHLAALLAPDDGAPVVRPAFFTALDPGLSDGDVVASYAVVGTSNPGLFAPGGEPSILPDGTFSLTVKPFEIGSAVVFVRLTLEGPGAVYSQPTSELHEVTATAKSLLRPPSFDLTPVLYAAQDGGPQSVPGFAQNITAGHPTEPAFNVSFTVSTAGTHLFAESPRISPNGTLTFTAAPGEHGTARVLVQIGQSDLPAGESPNLGEASLAAEIRVLPAPILASVQPRIGPTRGGSLVTVRGLYLGSEYSRGYSAPTYSGISLSLGGRPCAASAYVSDTELVCTAPEGSGLSAVALEINDGVGPRRSVELPAAFAFKQVFLGGLLGASAAASTEGQSADGAVGLFAVGPASNASDSAGAASLEATLLRLPGSVLAIATFHGTAHIGGSFPTAEFGAGGAQRVGHVVSFDGAALGTLGHGVDGAVAALAVHQGSLIVGGRFTLAMQPLRAGAVRTGGLAAWDGAAWAPVGGARLEGAVEALHSTGTLLYAGGRFQRVGGRPISGLAMMNASGAWAAVGGGVSGGCVQALAVDGEFVYAGGGFSRAGGAAGVVAHGLARWDGRAWTALGAFDGAVHALALLGRELFVGGDFTSIGGRPHARIARLVSGVWQPLGRGVDGGVHALARVGPCLYIAGAFAGVHRAPGAGVAPAASAARFCGALSAADAEAIEPVGASRDGGAVGPLRAVASVDEAAGVGDAACPAADGAH